jgi:threonine-phosphate decarboxylase
MYGHGDSFASDFCVGVDGSRLEPPLQREHGGNADRWARSVGTDAGEILDFSASINPLGPPRSARWAFLRSYGEMSRYPDPYGERLKSALAKHHGMSPAEVLLGNGSTQLIYLLCAALRPRLALVVGPTFSEYSNALTLAGARIRALTLSADEGFQLSLESLMAAWEKDCNMVFLATPNSVTGQLIPKTDIEHIAHIALQRKNIVVVDEAFIDFVESESVKRKVQRNPYLIVLRSLTKYYGIAGLRLGYLLGEAQRVKQFAAYQEPWCVNGPALNVALACLKNGGFSARTHRWLEREREFLRAELAALGGMHPLPSKANFLLVKIDRRKTDALDLRSFLLSKKILIRTCDSFGLGSAYFRVAVRQRQENRRLIEALAQWRAF